MIGRIVEVADDARHLSLFRGFMIVTATGEQREEIGRVPIDDIAAVIANAHGLSYTNNLLVALAERGAPFVLCGANHNVAGMLFSVDGNFQQAKRFDAQIAASKPLQKRIWSAIVRAKIEQQAAVIETIGENKIPVSALIEKVRSGDPDNVEAQAARRYWPMLFGDDFRRDQSAQGLNSLLNYGYTVLRACTARAVVAAGLHPTLGIYHSNEGNPMRLVDDLMEPFRPIIDIAAWRVSREQGDELTADSKRILVRQMYADLHTDAGMTPVSDCIQRLATSLAQVFLGEREKLDLPFPSLPLDL